MDGYKKKKEGARLYSPFLESPHRGSTADLINLSELSKIRPHQFPPGEAFQRITTWGCLGGVYDLS